MSLPNEGLSQRARRGELDEAERSELSLLLEGSLEERVVHQAGLAFDAEDADWAGDEALVKRISERLLAAPAAAPAPRLRWAKLALAGSAVALSALLLARPERSNEAPPVVAASARVAVAAPSAAPASDQLPSPRVSVDERPVAPPAEPSASVLAPRARELSAEELFAQANRARRERHPERAVALYRRLTTQFPRTKEALASEVPLAMLELKAQRNAAALAHFNAYLARAPQGELGSEALWGRAQAELGLGQAEAARRSLELLLKRYPNSAYAGSARARLEAKSE